MPWIKHIENYPPHYGWVHSVSDDTWLGRNIEHAVLKRRETGQTRELMLGYQKMCEQQKDYETARYFRSVASDLQKEYRGYDCAIRLIMEGKKDNISEEVAPYVDRAINAMECL